MLCLSFSLYVCKNASIFFRLRGVKILHVWENDLEIAQNNFSHSWEFLFEKFEELLINFAHVINENKDNATYQNKECI